MNKKKKKKKNKKKKKKKKDRNMYSKIQHAMTNEPKYQDLDCAVYCRGV